MPFPARAVPTSGPLLGRYPGLSRCLNCCARSAAQCSSRPISYYRRQPTRRAPRPEGLRACALAHARSSGWFALLRRRRECGQLADVARIVLDDDRRLEVLLDLLDALERGDGV